MNYTIVGADIAKNVMQLHWVDPDRPEPQNRSVARKSRLSGGPAIRTRGRTRYL